jgi:DNA-binding NarL/FixJ family response regulator
MSKKDPTIPLSARESEVLILVVKGLSSKKIGDKLHLSKRTVEVYRRNLLRKTNSRNAAELTSWAFKHGHVE